MASVPFPLRLEPQLKDRLEAIAREEELPMNDMASKAIAWFLDAREFKRVEIKAALAEADKGIFVSSEAVHRWMESWDTDNELPIPEPDVFPDDEAADKRR